MQAIYYLFCKIAGGLALGGLSTLLNSHVKIIIKIMSLFNLTQWTIGYLNNDYKKGAGDGYKLSTNSQLPESRDSVLISLFNSSSYHSN